MRMIQQAVFITALLFVLSCNMDQSSEKEMKALSDKVEKAEVTTQFDSTVGSSNGFLANAGTADYAATPPEEQQGEQEQQQQADQKKEKQKQPVTNQVIKTDWDKKIIKTASVNLEIKEYDKYYLSLREKVRNLGGYIAQEEQSQSDYKIENTMIIKVPVDQFDNAIVQLTANAEKINERKISSQDVTAEVVDTKSRMEAKKQTRQRYMDLMNQAKNMQDILAVQSEINSIQEEIESATGRIEYLGHASVFSTIHMTYYQVLNSAAKDTGDPKPSFGARVKGALHTGWEIVSGVFIALITIWPLVLGSFFAYLLYKKLRVQKPRQA